VFTYKKVKRPRTRRTTMTVDEYLRTPETVLPQELAYGVLRVAGAPTTHHQRAVGRLFLALYEHVCAHALGEVWLSPIDVILDPVRHLVVQPDLLFISHARSGIVTDRVRGAPELTVEILSPNPRIGTLTERVGWFAAYGVDECWLVDLERRRIDVLRFARGVVADRRAFDEDAAVRSHVLPAFSRSPGAILGY
jgi:Uma2 family endonuclease